MKERKMWDVLVYGDINIDVIIPGMNGYPNPGEEKDVEDMETHVGGGAALFAIGLAKLGMSAAFHGCIGDDIYGGFIEKELEKRKIDTSYLKITKGVKTGISLSFTNEDERSFVTMREETEFWT